VITVPTERPTALSAGIDEVRVGPKAATVVVVVDVGIVIAIEVDVVEVVVVDVDEVVVVEVVGVGAVVDDVVVEEGIVVPVLTTVVDVLMVGEVSDVGERGVVVEVEEVLEEVGADAVDEEVEKSVVPLVEDELATDSELGELCDELGHMAAATTTSTTAATKI
jgi:hypothetical protein